MKTLGRRVAVKSCVDHVGDGDGYVKLTDHELHSTLFFKNGKVILAFCRPVNDYAYNVGKEAIKILQEGTFFDNKIYTTDEKFISEMERYFPEASVDRKLTIKYPREEEMDEVLTNFGEKDHVKKEVMNFLEKFISENADDLGYVNGHAIKIGLENHLNTTFPDLAIDESIYDITSEIVEEIPKTDIKRKFEGELSQAIRTEEDADEVLKEEMTSLVTDVATEYIKDIPEQIEMKREVKEKSIEYFSDVISEHLEKAKKLSPFERGIHLKELILTKPLGDVKERVREHLEMVKKRFIEELDLIKRCHLCEHQITEGFICDACEEEYTSYREKITKLNELQDKIKRLYIQGKIDDEEYSQLIHSTKEKLILLQESGKKFTGIKNFVNL
jgi:hypothetical protein